MFQEQLGKSPELNTIQRYLDDDIFHIIEEIKDNVANQTFNRESLEINFKQQSYIKIFERYIFNLRNEFRIKVFFYLIFFILVT